MCNHKNKFGSVFSKNSIKKLIDNIKKNFPWVVIRKNIIGLKR